ncbi:unnamed protein product [Anisakis simplex]|uniref:SelP_N domain-containing protein n=1 Tax=Anisakis simplex TaxID=6269 RepID=A0A0M3JSD2_ANISI|nr:unnamed protein product [Anisakis simplex]
MVVIAPYNENHRSLMRFRNQFPKMHFHIESYNESVSNKLGATANDHFIYDRRCGRLSNVIRYPRSDVTRYDDILNALKTTINYSHCGWCIYDTLSTTTTPILAPSVRSYY